MCSLPITTSTQRGSVVSPAPETLASIRPIMQKYGVTCAADEFQRIVNLTFHRAESQVYDIIHKQMWDSLPQQFDLLVGDMEVHGPALPYDSSVLDIGCGTGLATELLLRTQLNSRIAKIDLLDTSEEMLAKASKRAERWGGRASFLRGDIDSLAKGTEKYHLIVACSLLHHIPDLEAFLRALRAVQAEGGYFLHLQDPNADYSDDPELQARMEEYARFRRPLVPKWFHRLSPARIAGKLRRTMGGQRDYIEQFNDELLNARVIAAPMDPIDIWAVTDIHIHSGSGISIHKLSQFLPGYELVSRRSYCFHGVQHAELKEPFRTREQQLLNAGALNGQTTAALWRLGRQ